MEVTKIRWVWGCDVELGYEEGDGGGAEIMDIGGGASAAR